MKRDHALELEPIEAMNGAVEANGNFRNGDMEGLALSQAALDGMAETNGAKPEPSQGVGRLSRPPNPVLFRLLYEKQSERDLVEVLPHLLRIDAAHVVMLAHTNLLRPKVAAELLSVNRELGRLMKLGKEAFPTRPQHRGFYFLYEQEYIDRLGKQVGGAAHLARSRNDINATVTRARLRDELLEMLAEFCKLSHTMAAAGQKYSDAVICGFTHMQPAQPSTLGHYIAAVLSELVRSAEILDSAYDMINCSPMGAAAGLGTSFAIDRGEVAQLLGFPSIIPNSADAVASRDYLVHVLSGMAMLGISLTRFATDFQIWSSAAYGFLGWDDDLVSTSSIMPQKRNAFVWENIRGKAITPLGGLVNTLTGMKNVSFNNTVEVSAEASGHIWPALKAMLQAIQLVRLLIERLQVYPEKMREFLEDKQTTMTAVADLLVARYGLAFRAAHDSVSRLINQYPDIPPAEEIGPILERIVADVAHMSLHLDGAELAMALDPVTTAAMARYGGGSSPAAVQAQVGSLVRRTSAMERRLKRRRLGLRLADQKLQAAVDEIVTQNLSGADKS
jgi:argininosuccinate lyase